ncbi:uncharacterized protein LOC129584635 [Paramacrobiotus metropolitanus]|uniref:uncharacterized protein LOC129584635 n=1 Tax=Paramacrobiotus metropolitanus TaxID=2943436 RepID=UPI0024461CE8|nr:uncharacterized protein LOC129584635 [Paramacrobiotus metropolitanus]
MTRVFVALALLGVACATPVPSNTLPKVVLGLYEPIPETVSSNFAEFAKTAFHMPEHIKLAEPNFVAYRKDGETYHKHFWYPGQNYYVDMPFKLGEKMTTTMNGKTIEYEITAEGDDNTATIHAKLREVDGDVKFTVETRFDKFGYNATYTKDALVAKISYRRTLPFYVFGAYELDITKSSPNTAEFYNNFFPLPKGLTWTKDTKFFVGRHGNKFYEKFIVDATYYEKVEFELNKPGSIQHGNHTVNYHYEVVETTKETTTLRITYKCPEKGTLVFTCVFDHEGVTSTAKSDKGEVKTRYNRVLPWLFYGKFKEVPEKTENYEEFTKGEDCPFAHKNQPATLEIFKKGDHYGARKSFGEEKAMEFEFKLNTPQEFQANGKTFKYNVTIQSRGDKVIMHSKIKVKGTDKWFIVEEQVAPEGLYVTYKREGVVAKKFLRRVLPKTVFGTFESTDNNDEFKAFTTHIGAPELFKKITIEFSDAENGVFVQKLTPEGDATQESRITFGKPDEITVHGKHLEQKWFYYEVDNTPVLRGSINQTDNANNYFDVVGIFRPDGYTATFVYDHNTKIAHRTYTRKGAAVPFEPAH